MKKTFNAFTMAEILISLTIIGIIAALTLPSLMVNINEKVWNTQRKALHARMAQAIGSMNKLNNFRADTAEGGHSAAYNFINDGLGSALNITKICDGVAGYGKCDFPTTAIRIQDEETFNTTTLMQPTNSDPVPAVFNTVNGDSIVVVYNPNCEGSTRRDFLTKKAENLVCATFLYDLNGAAKGPNKMGKDMGVLGAFFPEYPTVVAPMPATMAANATTSNDAQELGSASSDFRLPTEPEAYLLTEYFMNNSSITNLWADNDVLCTNAKTFGSDTAYGCSTSTTGTGFAIAVNKTGDAPQTWETDSRTAQERCTDRSGTWDSEHSTCD